MRGSPTSTEELLWARIRCRRLGVIIRRQVPLLGRFIADFLAPAQRLVIEVDGAYHAERARADARRHAALVRAGYRVLRLNASLVTRDIDSALGFIRAAEGPTAASCRTVGGVGTQQADALGCGSDCPRHEPARA